MGAPEFSRSKRKSQLERLGSIEYELLIIGGGITGAGIALDASSRGLKTALIEKTDYAYGTSSRSTKLIHGGLRYLKQLELGLVYEVGRERAIVHRNAPHLVLPERMLLPIVEGGTLQRFGTSLALMVYDLLAGVRKEERRVMLDSKKTAELEPLLRTDILKGGGLYYEYRTDDARLVIENIKTAIGYGAECLNYCSAGEFIYNEEGKVRGLHAVDELSGETLEIKAKQVVNAAGPWVDLLRKKDNSLQGKRLQLTKGVHLVVPYEKMPIAEALYFDRLEDGRMIFAIPRDGITYLGTTDTVYADSIESPECLAEDVEYLLDTVNSMFPSVGLTPDDVESSWAGLRPLIHEDGKSPSELSRKDELFESESGLISIAGGKLTGYRMMSKRVTDQVFKALDKSDPGCKTADIPLCGTAFKQQREIAELVERIFGESRQVEIPFDKIRSWVYRYGSLTEEIVAYAYQLQPTVKDARKRAILAELAFGIRHEQVCRLSDFFVRRSGMLYFQHPEVIHWKQDAIEFMAAELSLTEAECNEQMEQLEAELLSAIAFRGERVIN